ncbi:MAG TPA: response regulator, partial [Stellaceae bacterium]
DYVRRLLAPRYEVLTVGDGAASLAALRQRRVDLLLSDVMMPRLGGFGLVREIRADPALAELPIILLSARAGEEASIEGLEAGANDYLVKPFSARELLARVASNLEMARLRSARDRAAAALREIERHAAAERDRAQDEIRTSQKQLEAIFNDSPLGIYLVDGDFRIRQVNPTAQPVFGNIPELIGRDFEEVIHILWPKAYADEVVARFRHALQTGEPYIMPEHIEQRLDRGVTEYYEWQINRIPLPEGRHGVVCYFRDISTQVLARQAIAASERRLRELNESLERMVDERSRALHAEMVERQKIEAALQQAQRLEAIGQLTGGVAHDFNNLLTVVIGQTESIAAVAADDQRIKRMAASAQRAAERGAQLTNQLLSFSGRQQLKPVTLSVDKLIRSVGDLVRRTIGETITVEISVDPELWRSHLDPAQFESAVLNLAINARDAMPGGGRLVIDGRNVSIGDSEARRLDLSAGDYVITSVSDSGSGMTAEVRRRAFEPFYTTKDIGKGTGLGLSQIYGFVRQSGGTATIDSAPDQGTTVALYLPRAHVPASEERDAAGRREPRRGGGKTILVVEDQADVREMLEASLRGLDYRVVTAADGVEARRLLESSEPIDLLLTDVVMPRGVSGLDLAEDARRLRPELKIVLISGYLRDNQSRLTGAADLTFLEKPFLQAQLADTVASALGVTG